MFLISTNLQFNKQDSEQVFNLEAQTESAGMTDGGYLC